MTKLTIEFTPRHFNLPRAPAPGVDPRAIPVGKVDERGESGRKGTQGQGDAARALDAVSVEL